MEQRTGWIREERQCGTARFGGGRGGIRGML